MFSAKGAIFTLAMQRRRDLCDVPLMLGDHLECGGKRSATPLCLVSFAGMANHLTLSCARGSHRREKSAVAASLCRRSPKCWLNGLRFRESRFMRKLGG